MKNKIKGLLALVLSVLIGQVWAATPVATWTDFNTLTSGSYTLTADMSTGENDEGCAVNSDGSITLGGAGLSYAFRNGDGMYANKRISVIMDVSLPTSGGTLMTLGLATNKIRVNSTGSALTTSYDSGNARQTGGSLNDNERTTLAITYEGGSGGTHVYKDGELIITDEGLRWSGQNLNKLTIGAFDDGSISLTDMKVYSLRIYAEKLSAADIVSETGLFQEVVVSEDKIYSELGLEEGSFVKVVINEGVTLTMDEPSTCNSLMLQGPGTVAFVQDDGNPFAEVDNLMFDGVTLQGDEDEIEISNLISIASGKTLKTKGNLKFSGANTMAGTLEVVSGETTFNLAERGLTGTVKVAAGATFKNGTNDGPDWGGAPTFDIAGTLEVTGTARWSLSANTTTILREGAVLKGAGGTGYNYAYDYFNGATITVLGNATIEGNIGAHQPGQTGTIVFNIAEGKTLTLKGKYDGAVYSGPKPSMQVMGAGTLKLENENTHGGTTVDEGATILVANASALPGAITNNGTITYKVDATPANTLSGEGVTGVDAAKLNMLSANLDGYTGTFAVANNGTLILPAGKEEGVRVAEGCTLKLDLSVEQLKGPYTTSATIDGGSFIFTKNNGAEEITEGVEGGAYTPAGAVTYTVATTSWDNDPFVGARVVVDFGDTTDQFVNVKEILGNVTSIALLTVRGSNGGTLVCEGVTIPATDIETTVVVNSYNNQFGAITISPDASLKLAGMTENVIYNVTGKTPEAGQARPKLIVKASADCGLADNEATSISNVDFEVAEGSSLFYLRSQKIGAGVALIANGPVALEGTANTLNLVGLSGAGNFKASNSWDGHGFAVNVTLPEGAENAYSGVLSQHGSQAVSLAVSGAGKLTLTGANAYTGGTTINNGATLVAASATALGTGNVANSGTLELNATDVEATLAQVISGGGAINVKAGSWALTAANTGNKNVTIESGAMVDISSENARLGYEGQASGSVVTVKGTLKVRDWNWDTNNCLGKLDHNPARLIIEGGKIIFTANITSQRKATLNGDVTFEINKDVIYTAQEAHVGNGNLTIDGFGTLALTASDSLAANSSATVIINANATLQAAGTGTTFYRTVLGEGKIVIPEGKFLAIGESDRDLTETASGLSNFAGTLEIAGTFDARSWGRREYTIGACNIDMQGGSIVKQYGDSAAAKIVIASGKTFSGTGTIEIPVTLADGATLAGPVTVNNTVTIDGTVNITHATKADDVVIICNNAADIVASLPTAPQGLKYVVDGTTVKLAAIPVAQIGDVEYATLQEAVDAAEAGAEIILIADIELTAFVSITKSITLDLNGKSINRANGTALYVDGDVNVTIQGEGSVSGSQAVYVNAGTVVIKGGNFHGYNGGHAVYVQGTGKALIENGIFSSDEGQYHYVLNKYDADRENTSIVVKGGKYLNFDPSNNGAEGPNTNFCADGLTAVLNEETGYYEIVDAWTAPMPELEDGESFSGDYEYTSEVLSALKAKAATSVDVKVNGVELKGDDAIKALNAAVASFDDALTFDGTAASLDIVIEVTEVNVEDPAASTVVVKRGTEELTVKATPTVKYFYPDTKEWKADKPTSGAVLFKIVF